MNILLFILLHYVQNNIAAVCGTTGTSGLPFKYTNDYVVVYRCNWRANTAADVVQ